MDIYIIEDEESQRKRLSEYIEKEIKDRDLPFKIKISTGNSVEFVRSIENDGQRGIYFIDIDLGEDVHGIEIAELIRKHDKEGYIIFVTSHSELKVLTFEYKVDAMDFIEKDNLDELHDRVTACLLKVRDAEEIRNVKNNNIFEMKTIGKIIKYDIKNILFFEQFDNDKVIMHGVNRQIEFLGDINKILDNIKGNFFLINNKCIVNLDLISNVECNGKFVEMLNGEKCKIGFFKKSRLKKAIENIT